jgi:hypothetical protein
MPSRRLIYHPLEADANQAAEIRLVLQQARELLKQPLPDTFLGRRRFVPFPNEDDQGPAEL